MTKQLPVVGTSAATTAFCTEKLEGPEGLFLYLDGNAKITLSNGTYENPKPNALSLLAVDDCPGSTPTCRSSCYVVTGLQVHRPDIYDLYRHNSQEIRRILDLGVAGAMAWADHLAAWVKEHAPAGFRWHVSGDVFSYQHACWIRRVCLSSVGVDHWIYTRSFERVSSLVGAPNLAVNLSADKDNWQEAQLIKQFFPTTRICYLCDDGVIPEGLDLAADSVIFPDYSLRDGTGAGLAWFAALPPERKKMVCPVDRIGKSEERRCGPCPRCLRPSETAS